MGKAFFDCACFRLCLHVVGLIMFGPEPTLKVASSFNPVLVAMGGTPAEEVSLPQNNNTGARNKHERRRACAIQSGPTTGPRAAHSGWLPHIMGGIVR